MKRRFDVTMTIEVEARDGAACREVAEAFLYRMPRQVGGFGASSEHGEYDYRVIGTRRMRPARKPKESP